MALFDTRGSAAAMADLLDRERQAILAGRFDALKRLLPEKERLVRRLERTPADPHAAEALLQKAAHNGRLLEAVRVGLKDAGARIAALRGPRADLQTYDAAGRKSVLGAPSGTVKRR